MSSIPKKSMEETEQELNRFCSKSVRPYPRRILFDAQRMDISVLDPDAPLGEDGKPVMQRPYVVLAIDEETKEIVSCTLTSSLDDRDTWRRAVARTVSKMGHRRGRPRPKRSRI